MMIPRHKIEDLKIFFTMSAYSFDFPNPHGQGHREKTKKATILLKKKE
jgi:hypothetical protein